MCIRDRGRRFEESVTVTRVCLTQRLADALQRGRTADVPRRGRWSGVFRECARSRRRDAGWCSKNERCYSRPLRGDAGGMPPIPYIRPESAVLELSLIHISEPHETPE